MKIDGKGLELSDLNDILNAYELMLQSKYGSDFYIKPEGIIDNIVNSSGFMEMSLQDQIAFLGKQFDPETAEGVWQDKLYERINVYRFKARPTIFTKNIIGAAGFTGSAGSITIRSNTTQDEFTNKEAYTIGENGNSDINFECVVTGIVQVNKDDTFQIVEAPDQIIGIGISEATNIAIGQEREEDGDFRIRFRNSKAINAKATRNANEANLTKHIDNIAFLKLIDKKNDNTFAPGTLLIIAKHNTTDEIFADAIFNTVADGIDLLGDTNVIVKDKAGEDVKITFKKAEEPEIYIQATVKVREGYYHNTVLTNAKQNILKYIERRVFGLESIIYATEFIIPILETDGVEAVTEIKVKNGVSTEFTDSISLTREQAPNFSIDRISLIEPAGRR